MDIDLNTLSVDEIVELATHLQNETTKEASEDLDLNSLSVDEIIELGQYLQADMPKEASTVDLNDFSAQELVELAHHLEEGMEKDASEAALDINELSVDEFLQFADALEDDMEKEANVGRRALELMLWKKTRAGDKKSRNALDALLKRKGTSSEEAKEARKSLGTNAAAAAGVALPSGILANILSKRSNKGK